MPTQKDAKAMAKSLRAALAERNVALSHGECLELVARQLGFTDWNTLSARLATEETPVSRTGHPGIASPQGVTPAPETVAARVPLIPLRDVVVYPEMVIPIFLGRPKSVHAAEMAMSADKRVILVTQRRPEVNDPVSEDLYQTGTVALVLDISHLPNGTVRVMMKGVARAHLEGVHADDPPTASVALLKEVRPEGGVDMEGLRKALLARFERYAKHSGLEAKLTRAGAPALDGLLATLSKMEPGMLADTLAAQTSLPLPQKQQVLEILDVRKRFEYINAATGEMESLSPSSK